MNVVARRFFVAIAGAACAAAFLGKSTARASAASLQCGSKITKDVKLTKDLTGCKSNGLVIGADGVTIDLNSHTISGDGALKKNCKKKTICDDGIVAIGRQGAVVEDGTVTNFAIGMLALGGDRARFTNVASVRNQFSGIDSLADHTLIEFSDVSGNGAKTQGAGAQLFHAASGRVVRTKFSDNGGPGLELTGSVGARVDENRFNGNGETGIVDESANAIISRNEIKRTGDGIFITGSGNLVIGNVIDCGCKFTGITLNGGSQNTITSNRVSGPNAAGIFIGLDPKAPPTRANRVTANTITGSRKDGIRVTGVARGTRLVGNTATGSSRNGFTIQSASTTLKSNTAIASGAFGFAAVRGVTDAGGNRSSGGRCRNVRC